MVPLKGRTALVTGASRGIGRAVAVRLAADGALVAVHYSAGETAAKEVVAEITDAGGEAFAVRADLGLDDGVEILFAGLEAGLNGRKLDILINNAAILDTTPYDRLTRDIFEQTWAINVVAPLFVTQRALPLLPEGGRVINISSTVTRIAGPFLHYAMAKGAVEVMTRGLAQMLGGRGVTVNTVTPGAVDTDMAAWLHAAPGIKEGVASITALGRIGEPDDIAGVIAFLASADARWVTGAAIDASGGQWLGHGGPHSR
ncbi:SDR family oxidoreductase [Spongiactinospora sp. TRM90649]|uniref:SDR family NAD(P)-dependent oxidoreductase n=1 Tax=Spongiactinospora sp. TRM90649 TaxID=3031114 RepID=UPI0023F7FDCD|nr:SDR family oxidoreductase [Spongiactinospora sp. TRM90649]MDF5751555.1 SDR family oxidoreductase [Spongiactinospora sp. TRM90649]